MSLIGDERLEAAPSSDPVEEEETRTSHVVPSPQLKEALSSSDCDSALWLDLYQQTLLLVRDLFHKCRLVHADLSEYNLLLKDGTQVFAIDFGQAVDVSHPQHLVYLRRDLETITSFFAKAVDRVIPVDEAMSLVVAISDTNDDNLKSAFLK